MATDLQIIIDDNSGAFSYSWSGGSNSSSPWVLSQLTEWYHATSWYISSTTQTGTLVFVFHGMPNPSPFFGCLNDSLGTSATFIGNTPTSYFPQTATVQIDNGTAFGINYDDPNPPTYKQWFTTPTLSDGRHTVTISKLRTAIDYAVVNVGNNTSLTGQTVVVDDDSSLIQYSGQWYRNTNQFIPGNLPVGYPYRNVTHRSSNPGDSFTFQFSGTSVSIYGIFSWFNLGSLTATYTVDGMPYNSTISVTTSSPSYLNKDGEMSNYLYFSLDNLSAGNHKLVVNVTQADNQTFILDYISYKPSFNSLATMPNITGTSTSSTSRAVSSATSQGTAVATVSSSGSQQPVSTGTIVGASIGALAFGILLTALVVYLVLRRRKTPEWNRYSDSMLVFSSNHFPSINSPL